MPYNDLSRETPRQQARRARREEREHLRRVGLWLWALVVPTFLIAGKAQSAALGVVALGMFAAGLAIGLLSHDGRMAHRAQNPSILDELQRREQLTEETYRRLTRR